MNIITLGTFDLFHVGHANLLDECDALAKDGEINVGLNSDEFVKKFKGSKPIMPYEERKRAIYRLSSVESLLSVHKNDQRTGSAKDLILKIHADLIVIGSDWGRKDYLGQLGIDWDWLDKHGVGLCYVNYTPEISSTIIKQRCQEQ